MPDLADSDTASAWLWVIEYLASLEEIDLSIVQDLLEAAPDLPDDLWKNIGEFVALRCLEDLFGYVDGLSNDICFAPNPKTTFDFSESCEHVLESILKEIPQSNLDMAGCELLKWDIQPFIMHKRASIRKCCLEQLKDSVLEGINPYTASSKKLSGLVHTNDEKDKISTGYGEPNPCTLETDGYGQTMTPKESSLPLPCENENRVGGDDLHERNVLPSKRDKSELADENLAGNYVENIVNGDCHSNSKRFKALCPNQSGEQISIPLQSNSLIEDSSKRMSGYAKKQDSRVAKESTVAEVEVSRSFENNDRSPQDADDKSLHNGSTTASNKVLQDISQDEAGPAELRLSKGGPSMETEQNVDTGEPKDDIIYCNQPNPSSTASLSRFQEKINVDEAKGAMKHLSQEDLSSDNNSCDHERVDVDLKKRDFLSSQRAWIYGFMEGLGQMEQNLCVKCSKGGQLLACSVDGCPFVFHDSCLGSSVRFNESGEFCCPFCTFSLATSEYLESKKGISSASNELNVFFKELSQRLDGKVQSSALQNGDEEMSHDDENLAARKYYKFNGKHVHEANDEFGEKKGQTQLVDPSASDMGANLLGEEEPHTNGGLIHLSSGEKNRGGVVQECPSTRELDRQQNHVCSDPKCNDDYLLPKNDETAPVNQRKVVGESQNEVLQQLVIDSTEKPVCAMNIDGEMSEDEERTSSIQLRKRERTYTYLAVPQVRRKKVPWTAKEEEMLKEGIQKFSCVYDKNIPWEKILDYGASVFQNCRTTKNLKDKWKNMCRGNLKSL